MLYEKWQLRGATIVPGKEIMTSLHAELDTRTAGEAGGLALSTAQGHMLVQRVRARVQRLRHIAMDELADGGAVNRTQKLMLELDGCTELLQALDHFLDRVGQTRA